MLGQITVRKIQHDHFEATTRVSSYGIALQLILSPTRNINAMTFFPRTWNLDVAVVARFQDTSKLDVFMMLEGEAMMCLLPTHAVLHRSGSRPAFRQPPLGRLGRNR